jgi:hypothetical protein
MPCVFFGMFSMLQGHASADDRSLKDECRAKIRAEFMGPACRKSQANQPGESCYISPRDAMQFGFQDRVARCVDRAMVRRWQVAI